MTFSSSRVNIMLSGRVFNLELYCSAITIQGNVHEDLLSPLKESHRLLLLEVQQISRLLRNGNIDSIQISSCQALLGSTIHHTRLQQG